MSTSTAAIANDSLSSLLDLNQTDLNALYSVGRAGEIPDGDSHGRAIFFPGTLLNVPTSVLASLIWQGKVFDTKDGVLLNKVFGFRAIKARVYKGKSWFDGQESIIVDYQGTSLAAGWIRDEIREISPGIFLGRAYARTWLGSFFLLNFALGFDDVI